MLLDIVSEVLASEKDFIVVGQTTITNWGAAAKRARADVAIVHHSGDISGSCEVLLLAAQRQLKIITLSGDGRHGFLSELQPRCTTLGKMSAPRLIDAIRAAVEGKSLKRSLDGGRATAARQPLRRQ